MQYHPAFHQPVQVVDDGCPCEPQTVGQVIGCQRLAFFCRLEKLDKNPEARFILVPGPKEPERIPEPLQLFVDGRVPWLYPPHDGYPLLEPDLHKGNGKADYINISMEMANNRY